jgi:hypothetical protein
MPNVRIRLLEKLLKIEVTSRNRTKHAQAKLFAEQLDAVLHRYQPRRMSSAEVVQRLVDIVRSLRQAGRRHEQVGLTAEETGRSTTLCWQLGQLLSAWMQSPPIDRRRCTVSSP